MESVKRVAPYVEETGQKQPPFALGGRERGDDFQPPGSLCRLAKPSQVVGQSGVPEMASLAGKLPPPVARHRCEPARERRSGGGHIRGESRGKRED